MSTPTSLLTTGTVAATAPTAHPGQALAERLYGSAPPVYEDRPATAAIQQIRTEDGMARQFYKDAEQFGPQGGAAKVLATVMNHTGTDAQLTASASAIASMAVDVGLTREDLNQFAAYAEQVARKPPTQDERTHWQRTIVAELRQEYAGRFDQAFEMSRALASRHPTLTALLRVTGLGDHPAVVKRMVELSQSSRVRAQLAKKS